MSLKVMGIDPSLSCTGVALFDGSTETAETMSIKTADAFSTIARIDAIVKRIVHIVEKFEPDIVAIESAIVATRHGVQMGVLFLHGALRYELYDTFTFYLPVVDIYPLGLKKYALGDDLDVPKEEREKRGKKQMLAKALAVLPTIANADEADAYWLMAAANAAYEFSDDQDRIPDFRREVLANIDWPEVKGIQPKWTKKGKKK